MSLLIRRIFPNWKRKFITIHSAQFSVSNYIRLIQVHNQQTLTKFGGSLRYLVYMIEVDSEGFRRKKGRQLRSLGDKVLIFV